MTFALQPQDWASLAGKPPDRHHCGWDRMLMSASWLGEGRRGRMSFAPRFGGRELQEREPVGQPQQRTREGERLGDRAPRAHLMKPAPAPAAAPEPNRGPASGIRDAGSFGEAGGGAPRRCSPGLGEEGRASRARMPSATPTATEGKAPACWSSPGVLGAASDPGPDLPAATQHMQPSTSYWTPLEPRFLI